MSKRDLHNALFVAVFIGNKRLAIAILQFLLGIDRASQLDFRTLKFEPTVFTDTEGNERRADAIVSVMSKSGGRVLFLFEHKSYQNIKIFSQLLAYQATLHAQSGDRVIPVVISNAGSKWWLPRSFRQTFTATIDGIGRDEALDFGYLLLHLPDYDRTSLRKMFSTGYPHVLALKIIRELDRDAVAELFTSSLGLPLDERNRLIEYATDCYSKYNSNFNLKVLEGIERDCVANVEKRAMGRIRLGREGWLEEGVEKGLRKGKQEGRQEGKQEGRQEGKQEGQQEGRQEGRQEVQREMVLRLLQSNVEEEIICEAARISKKELTLLKKKFHVGKE